MKKSPTAKQYVQTLKAANLICQCGDRGIWSQCARCRGLWELKGTPGYKRALRDGLLWEGVTVAGNCLSQKGRRLLWGLEGYYGK